MYKRKKGFEPSTFALATQRSTIELLPHFLLAFLQKIFPKNRQSRKQNPVFTFLQKGKKSFVWVIVIF